MKGAGVGDPTSVGADPNLIPGVPEKYQTKGKDGTYAINHEAWAKSHKDMEAELGRLRRQQPGKPPEDVAGYLEGYDLDALGKAAAKLGVPAKDDPAMVAFFDASKAAGVSKEAAQAQWTALYGAIDAGMTAPQTDEEVYAEAVKGLGPTGEQMAKDIGAWGQGLLNAGVLDKAGLDELGRLSASTQGLKTLHALRTRMVGSAPPPSQTANGGITEEQIEEMVADPRYLTDRSFQQRVREKAAILWPDTGAGGPSQTPDAVSFQI